MLVSNSEKINSVHLYKDRNGDSNEIIFSPRFQIPKKNNRKCRNILVFTIFTLVIIAIVLLILISIVNNKVNKTHTS